MRIDVGRHRNSPGFMLAYLADVRSTYDGFSRLAVLHDALLRAPESDKVLSIDFATVNWFDGNMVAPLGAILSTHASDGRTFEMRNLKPRIRRLLERNGFLGERGTQAGQTSIPYKRFALDGARLFATYTDQYLKGNDIPEMSEQVRRKFLEGLDELFNNAAVHSETKGGIFTCGQAFPRKGNVEFSIADAGVGMRRNILRHIGTEMAAPAAIDWAMSGKNTTKQGDLPGGLGLKILREFITLNKGSLMVVSDAGYWSLRGGNVSMRLLSRPFPGTAVNIEINTHDESVYYLASEMAQSVLF